MQRRALGKGLEAIFGGIDTDGDARDSSTGLGRRLLKVPVTDIVSNHNQPRRNFDEAAMAELCRSIEENGILEPPVVRRAGDVFELVAGERRYRAARMLGMEKIEVLVAEVDDRDMLVLSLIENIQREDLNAIEEALAYRRIMDESQVTQEQLANVVGKSRSTVANTLRLLNLAEEVRAMIRDGRLAPGSARPLVSVENRVLQIRLAQKIAAEGLSARQAEALVKRALAEEHPAPAPKAPAFSPHVEQIRENLQRILGTAVAFRGSEEKGRIEIAYYSGEDLERILEVIIEK